MKIFGHPWVESECFYPLSSIDDIKQTPANSILFLTPLPSSLELAHYCQQNHIGYALEVHSIEEAVFANLMQCQYVITDKMLAKELMPIAQNYLFDTQVLAQIENDNEIETMAKVGVDGVIFPNAFSIPILQSV
ncbi:MAG: hypothetical protein K0U38_03285 [Epsilonproteobacteria bacterium]|nr:hypothetical protein [Campylobacterota bacterium]